MREVLGLVFTYVFALQLFLASAVATRMAVEDTASPFVICYGNSGHDDTGNTTTSHRQHTPCAGCVFAASASTPVDIDAAIAVRFTATRIETSAPLVIAHSLVRYEPRTSRGPPTLA